MCKRAFLKFAGVVGVPARRRAPCLVGLHGNSTAGNDWSADEEPRVADIEEKLTIGNDGSPIADIEAKIEGNTYLSTEPNQQYNLLSNSLQNILPS